MIPIRSLASNTVFQIGGKTLIIPIRLGVNALLARHLHQQGFGVYSLAITVMTFLTLLVDLGISDIVVREVSKNWKRFNEVLLNLLVLKVVLAALAVGVGSLAMVALRYSPEIQRASLLANLTLAFAGLSSIGLIAYRVRLEMKYAALSDLVADAAYLLLLLVLTRAGASLDSLLVALLATRGLHAVCMLGIMVKRYRPHLAPLRPGEILKLLRASFPLWLSQVMSVIYCYVDILMLSKMTEEKTVGIYSASSSLIYHTVFIPLAVMHSVFPLMCRYFEENRETLKILYQKSLDVVLILAIPMATAVSLFSNEIIHFLYGPEYAPSADALRILIWAAAGMFVSTVCPFTFIALHQQNKILFFGVSGVVINVALNLVLIPTYSYLGASAATLITEFAVLLPSLALISGLMKFIPSPRTFLKICLVSGGSAVAVLLVARHGLPVRAAVGIMSFVALFLLLKTVSRQDLLQVLGRFPAPAGSREGGAEGGQGNDQRS